MKASIVEVAKKMPLFVFDISDQTDILQSAETAILQEQAKNPVPRKSNVSAHYISSYESHKDNPNFAPLIELTLQYTSDLSESHYGPTVPFHCRNCWGAIYQPGDSARSHHHFAYDFAAVCYLRVDTGAAPIVFEESYEFHPRVGSLIIFSGLLMHHVPPTGGGRTVVGMNIVKGPAPAQAPGPAGS